LRDIRLLAMTTAAALVGCRHSLAERIELPDEMRAAVLAIAPRGTPTAEAARRLTREGFACAPVRHASFGGSDSLTYAYCNASASVGSPVSRRWQLALVDSAGRLLDVRAKTGLIGP
jgi:hypothetical protein